MSVPKYDDLFNPLLKAMHLLGGSATVPETEEKVAEIMKLSDKDVNEIHRGSETKFNYNLAWARTYLKWYGLLNNSERGVWSLTSKGQATKEIDKYEVNKVVKKSVTPNYKDSGMLGDETEDDMEVWKTDMLEIIKKIPPADFERLCQRILRESGFIKVTVTGKPGDGGIDGVGIVKIASFLSFKVIFQCKRYQGSISSHLIREFKGTMSGRAEKGLFITTGRFTKEAIEEANRDGSAPIDLIDGMELAQKMKELKLGVNLKTEELVEVNRDWFANF